MGEGEGAAADIASACASSALAADITSLPYHRMSSCRSLKLFRCVCRCIDDLNSDTAELAARRSQLAQEAAGIEERAAAAMRALPDFETQKKAAAAKKVSAAAYAHACLLTHALVGSGCAYGLFVEPVLMLCSSSWLWL